ncbi:cob(I)yrinic acid a,c-diamide adenosyltransferase [Aeromicrobium sp. A1-2]|uniref:cob(I)yrinic acid a,c-diamide adenosyltransferase n=1 Tax=Aeromicrobium sp. A1-2 TaxID=2107713 RepID=UPI00352FE6CB
MRSWNQGWNVGVFQFVKSAKWRIGEQTVLERLGELHTETGEAGPSSGTRWAPAGRGHARRAPTRTTPPMPPGWAEVKRRLATETHDLYVLDEFTYLTKWAGSTSRTSSRP